MTIPKCMARRSMLVLKPGLTDAELKPHAMMLSV